METNTADAACGRVGDVPINDEYYAKLAAEIAVKISWAELARRLTELGPAHKCNRSAVNQWAGKTPPHQVRPVSAIVGIAMKRLRPDIYDSDYVPPQGMPGAAPAGTQVTA